MQTFWAIVWLATGFFQQPIFGAIQHTQETMPGAQFYDGTKLNIPVSTKDGLELYERWIHQGLSSLMSAVANKRAKDLNEYHRNKLYKCSKNAEDIVEHARCVVQAIDARSRPGPSQFNVLKKLLNLRGEGLRRPVSIKITTDVIHRIEFRTKRSIANRYNYKLLTEYETKTAFGILGKHLSRTIRTIKKKEQKQSWTTMISKIKTMQATIDERKQMGDVLRDRLKFGYLREGSPSRKAKTKREQELLLKYGLPQNQLRNSPTEQRQMSRKMFEIVKILRRAVKLAMVINGDNSTARGDNQTIRIASPRILSLIPEEVRDKINMLSPSLLSLHDRGEGLEKLTSVPNLLKAVVGNEYEEWLDFIVETSGVTDSVDKMEKSFSKEELPTMWTSMPRGIDGQPLYFTKSNLSDLDPEQDRKVKLFEKIIKSLTLQQLSDFNTTGYSILTRDQLLQLYGPMSPYNSSTALERFQNIRMETIHEQIIQSIRRLARMDLDSRKRRWKRQLEKGPDHGALSPLLLTSFIFKPGAVSSPIILSPVVLVPLVLSPAIYGAVILSPWLFVPIIVSPRLLCPAIVSPAVLSTIILSPLVLDPYILSPGLIVPYVLSPKVLSPQVLSPGVMTPLILNPFCLSPLIFSPTALTALVLSPFVLSPFVFSPSYLATTIFSPSALSPLINSTGEASTTIFSPSIFS